MKHVNTLIVGGGHAGVNLGCWLEKKAPNRSYIILERSDMLLPKWTKSRWEGFQLNTPVRFSKLFGEENTDDTLVRPLSEDIQRWNAHIEKMKLNYQLLSTVQQVKRNDDGDFTATVLVEREDGSHETETYTAKNVICANGCFDAAQTTSDDGLAKSHPEIKQHGPMGLKMSDLQPGGVLIVGGGQTGIQLADQIVSIGKHSPVALCTSYVGGCPRTYRGKDIFYWLEQAKFLFTPKAALKTMPAAQAEASRYGKNPILGATKPISFLSLHRQGVDILGRLEKIEGSEAIIKPNRAENVQLSISGYKKVLGMCMEMANKLEKEGHTFSQYELEEEWEIKTTDEESLTHDNGPSTYNLSEKGITNVIWATGFSTDFSWLDIPEVFTEFDERTKLPDDLQCKAVPGIFYTGFPWVGNRQSINIFSFDLDHKVIVENLRA